MISLIWNREVESIADKSDDVVQLELKIIKIFLTHDWAIEALKILSVSAAGSAHVVRICGESLPEINVHVSLECCVSDGLKGDWKSLVVPWIALKVMNGHL